MTVPTNPAHARTVAEIEAMVSDLWKDTADLMGNCEQVRPFGGFEWPNNLQKEIHRICGNPRCVNGDHWRLVDASANRRKP